MPLTPAPAPAPGVAAGVLGTTPLPACPFAAPPAFCCDWLPSLSLIGGVRWPAPLGYDSDDGACCCAVKACACCAVDGCVMYGLLSMMGGAVEEVSQ